MGRDAPKKNSKTLKWTYELTSPNYMKGDEGTLLHVGENEKFLIRL